MEHQATRAHPVPHIWYHVRPVILSTEQLTTYKYIYTQDGGLLDTELYTYNHVLSCVNTCMYYNVFMNMYYDVLVMYYYVLLCILTVMYYYVLVMYYVVLCMFA